MTERNQSRRPCWSFVAMLLVLSASLNSNYSAEAFTMQMKYKPPVQSSVNSIRSSRISRPMRPSSSRSDSSKKSTASLTHPDLTPSPRPTPSFADRMRGIALKEEQKGKTAPTKNSKLPPNVYAVSSLQDYKTVVGDERTKIVAVRFHAPYCKACRAMAPLFYHLANKFPNVKFVDVPVTEENINLHQGLGVPSLPFGHIYHPQGGLVEELRITRPHISAFANKLQSYVVGSCKLKEVGDVSCPYPAQPVSASENQDHYS